MADHRPSTRRMPRWVPVAALSAVLVVIGVIGLIVAAGRDQPAVTPPPSVAASATTPVTTPSPAPSSVGTSSAAATTPSPAASRTTTKPVEPAEPTAVATTKSPVPVGKKADVDAGLTAKVSSMQSVQGEAAGPGEVAGPAVRATVVLSNESGKTIDLSNTVINAYFTPEQRPASVLSGPGTHELPKSVKAGRQVEAVTVFAIPKADRDVILITVDYSVKTPVVAFQGPGPR